MGRRRLPDVFTFTSASIKSSVEFHKRICRAGEKTNVSDSLSKKLKNKTCDGGFHILVFGWGRDGIFSDAEATKFK